MDFLQPTSWDDALAAKAARPEAVPIAGGTDVMVELNFDARRPDALLDLTRVPELADWAVEDGRVRLGAGVSYTRLIDELGGLLPGLAMAARTVGSPQIRNRGTVGGNLGAASPAGDCHPPLLATGAAVEVASVRGTRTIPAADFYTGVKQNALAADELIAAVLIPAAAGPQQFSKIGTRNAMVIAVASFCISLRPAAQGGRHRHRVGGAHAEEGRGRPSGSCPAPWPRPACGSPAPTCPPASSREFGEQVQAAADPVDDVRGTAAYRRHGLAVMARRTLTWAWNSYQAGGTGRAAEAERMRITATVNGETRQADDVWEGESLLYVLRERLGLPGSKNACEQGECGSCTVYLDEQAVCACLVAAGQAQGRRIVTVEGLASGAALHPVQQAFVEAGAVQCGFCTPGLLIAAHDLLRRGGRPSDAEIREALAGNLCRCTGYEKILDAVRLAADRVAGPRARDQRWS